MQVCTELVFCQAVAQAVIAAAIFNNWHWKRASRCSPSSHHRPFISSSKKNQSWQASY